MTLPQEGWRHWHADPPPAGVLIEAARLADGSREWRWRSVGYVEEFLLPDFVRVYWRMTGIGREQLDPESEYIVPRFYRMR